MIKKTINLAIYLLRYFSIIDAKYLVTSKINFGSKVSNNFFKKKLKKSKFYFEYGSGNSTILANQLRKKFISIESDKSFFNYLKFKKKLSNLIYVDLGPTKYYSHPIMPYFLIEKKIKFYCSYINSLFIKLKVIPDFILIDGRFRVNTCLNILNFLLEKKIKKKIMIIIDDYQNRKNYKILEKIIKINKVGRFGIIKYFSYKNLNKRKIQNLILKVKKDVM